MLKVRKVPEMHAIRENGRGFTKNEVNEAHKKSK